MKKLISTLLVLFMTTSVAKANTEQAVAFAKEIANEIMSDVVLAKTPYQTKEEAFERIFVSATNITKIARFTLGRYARIAKPAEFESFKRAFVTNIADTWTRRFNDYAGEKIVFNSVRLSDNQKDYYVNSVLDIPNTENDITIIWRISNTSELKLVDLVVEGVSMILTYRNEYASILQKNGGNIKDLTSKLETINLNPKEQ